VLTNEQGKIFKTKQEIAKEFKNIQKNIFTPNKSNINEHDKNINQWYKNENFKNPNKNSIIKIAIKKLKNHKAPGIFATDNKLIKNIQEQITPILENIYNDWLNLSHFPEYYKIAKIIMVPKKQNKKNISEFRPISLLPTIGKIFEFIITKKINKWIEENNISNNLKYTRPIISIFSKKNRSTKQEKTSSRNFYRLRKSF